MIGKVGVTLHFPGDIQPTDVTHLVRDGSARFSERLFNDDKRSVQDTFTFSLKHDQSLLDKVRSAVDRVLVRVTDYVTSDPLFTGALDPSASQTTAQAAESISFEAIDSTWRLDVPIAASFSLPAFIGGVPFKVCDPADPSNSIFHQVCYLAGYVALEVVPVIASLETVQHCAAMANEETYREFLDGLLFEHKLVLDDDGAGNILVRRWARAVDGYDDTVSSGELSTVVPFTWSRRYVREDGARVEWAQLQEMPSALLYRDSLPVSSDGIFTGKAIAAGDYYPPDSDIEEMHQAYVESWLDKPYLERQTRIKNRDISLVATDMQSVNFSADAGVVANLQIFEPHRARVRFRNTGGATAKIYTFEIQGKALFRAAVQKALAPVTSIKPREYTSRFLFNATAANGLATALALDAVYGDFEYSFGLNRYIRPGTIIRILSEKNNIDTEAIVQDCTYESGKPVYQYVAVGIAEWSTSIGTSGSGSTSAALWPIIQAIDAQLGGGPPEPPSNNVTDVVFAFSQNADGTAHVTASWKYTNGVIKADLAYVYVKGSVGSAPDVFDYSLDKAEAQPMGTDGSYGWSADFPVRTGGSGGASIRYRFGVVAALGSKLHVDGAVTPSTWNDKQFTASFQFDVNNYWDLSTGELRAGNATNFIKVIPASGQIEISGLDLELTESELITRADGVELSHEGDALVWRDETTQDELARTNGVVGVVSGPSDIVCTAEWVDSLVGVKLLKAIAEHPYSGRIILSVDNSTGRLYHSTDAGVTWDYTNPFLVNDSIGAISWIEPLGMFVAVVFAKAYVYTSSDGISWISRAIPGGPQSYLGIVWDYANSRLIMLASSTNYTITSPDTINWTIQTPTGLTNTSWFFLKYSTIAGKFVLCGVTHYALSDDGINWTQYATSLTVVDFVESLSLGIIACISGQHRIRTTTDFISFTVYEFEPSAAGGLLLRSGYWDTTRGRFYIISQSRNVYASSSDGIEWKIEPLNANAIGIFNSYWLPMNNIAILGSPSAGSGNLMVVRGIEESLDRYSPSPGFIGKSSTLRSERLKLFDGTSLVAMDLAVELIEYFLGPSGVSNSGMQWAPIVSGTTEQSLSAVPNDAARFAPMDGAGEKVIQGIGVKTILSSASANSGGSYSWGPGFVLSHFAKNIGQRALFVGNGSTWAAGKSRWGYMNTLLVATPTHGAYFEQTDYVGSGHVWIPRVSINSVVVSGTSFTIVNPGLITFEIINGPLSSQITFNVYSGNRRLNSQTLTHASTIGVTLLSLGVVAWYNAAATAGRIVATIDTMAFYSAPMRKVYRTIEE